MHICRALPRPRTAAARQPSARRTCANGARGLFFCEWRCVADSPCHFNVLPRWNKNSRSWNETKSRSPHICKHFTHSGRILVALFCIARLQRAEKESCQSPPPQSVPFPVCVPHTHISFFFFCTRMVSVCSRCSVSTRHAGNLLSSRGQRWPFHSGKCHFVSVAEEI